MLKPVLGAVSWLDLTVPDAERVRDFYRQVAGWEPLPIDMGEYADFAMKAPGTEVPVAGVCHARGANAGLPATWLPYVTVNDLDARLSAATAAGGVVAHGPRDLGPWGRFAVVRDPAGAHAGLIEPPAPPPEPLPVPPMRASAARALCEENEAARLELYALLPRFPAEAFTTGNVETEDNVRGILCHTTACILSYACWIQRMLGRLDPEREKAEKADFLARVYSLTTPAEFEAASRQATTRYYAVAAELTGPDLEREFQSNWRETLTIELMMEHALVHLLRHRRQLEIHLGLRAPSALVPE
jgi:predicted enzyme related to lactoylglutathione lyase/uncharacterized damage-inducible protein DinB